MKFSSERLKELIFSDKARKILIAGGLALMLLLLLGSVSCGGGSKEVQPSEKVESSADIERELERRLCAIISRIDGAGDVSVMITLESSSKAVYEKDQKTEGTRQNGARTESSSETEVVLAGSAKQPLRVGTIQPTVRGAAVVCEGAGDPAVREKVANTVAKALNIGMSRVYVTN